MLKLVASCEFDNSIFLGSHQEDLWAWASTPVSHVTWIISNPEVCDDRDKSSGQKRFLNKRMLRLV